MTDTELTIEQRALDIVKQELNQYSPKQIDTVLALLEDGNTVPFIDVIVKIKQGVWMKFKFVKLKKDIVI